MQGVIGGNLQIDGQVVVVGLMRIFAVVYVENLCSRCGDVIALKFVDLGVERVDTRLDVGEPLCLSIGFSLELGDRRGDDARLNRQ